MYVKSGPIKAIGQLSRDGIGCVKFLISHSSEKEAPEARVAERNEELALLQTQIAEREMARPLLESTKEIFKNIA